MDNKIKAYVLSLITPLRNRVTALAASSVAQVSQTITNGVTTKSPSEDAVFDALALKADLASPVLTGNPTAPTQSNGNNSTRLATTEFVQNTLAFLDIARIKGTIDASSNPNYPGADAGDIYVITVAGKVGGGSGKTVEVGELILCTVDGSLAGTEAAVGANWVATQVNLVGALLAANNLSDLANAGTARTNLSLGNVDNTSDAAKPVSTAQQTALDLKQNIAWTVVESSAATVSPAAADSGKYYRLSHVNPTFNLPTTGLTVGSTEFYVTFTGAATQAGTVDAGTGKTVDSNDALFESGAATQTVSNIKCFQLYHIKYIATNTWASNLLHT